MLCSKKQRSDSNFVVQMKHSLCRHHRQHSDFMTMTCSRSLSSWLCLSSLGRRIGQEGAAHQQTRFYARQTNVGDVVNSPPPPLSTTCHHSSVSAETLRASSEEVLFDKNVAPRHASDQEAESVGEEEEGGAMESASRNAPITFCFDAMEAFAATTDEEGANEAMVPFGSAHEKGTSDDVRCGGGGEGDGQNIFHDHKLTGGSYLHALSNVDLHHSEVNPTIAFPAANAAVSADGVNAPASSSLPFPSSPYLDKNSAHRQLMRLHRRREAGGGGGGRHHHEVYVRRDGQLSSHRRAMIDSSLRSSSASHTLVSTTTAPSQSATYAEIIARCHPPLVLFGAQGGGGVAEGEGAAATSAAPPLAVSSPASLRSQLRASPVFDWSSSHLRESEEMRLGGRDIARSEFLLPSSSPSHQLWRGERSAMQRLQRYNVQYAHRRHQSGGTVSTSPISTVFHSRRGRRRSSSAVVAAAVGEEVRTQAGKSFSRAVRSTMLSRFDPLPLPSSASTASATSVSHHHQMRASSQLPPPPSSSLALPSAAATAHQEPPRYHQPTMAAPAAAQHYRGYGVVSLGSIVSDLYTVVLGRQGGQTARCGCCFDDADHSSGAKEEENGGEGNSGNSIATVAETSSSFSHHRRVAVHICEPCALVAEALGYSQAVLQSLVRQEVVSKQRRQRLRLLQHQQQHGRGQQGGADGEGGVPSSLAGAEGRALSMPPQRVLEIPSPLSLLISKTIIGIPPLLLTRELALPRAPSMMGAGGASGRRERLTPKPAKYHLVAMAKVSFAGGEGSASDIAARGRVLSITTTWVSDWGPPPRTIRRILRTLTRCHQHATKSNGETLTDDTRPSSSSSSLLFEHFIFASNPRAKAMLSSSSSSDASVRVDLGAGDENDPHWLPLSRYFEPIVCRTAATGFIALGRRGGSSTTLSSHDGSTNTCRNATRIINHIDTPFAQLSEAFSAFSRQYVSDDDGDGAQDSCYCCWWVPANELPPQISQQIEENHSLRWCDAQSTAPTAKTAAADPAEERRDNSDKSTVATPSSPLPSSPSLLRFHPCAASSLSVCALLPPPFPMPHYAIADASRVFDRMRVHAYEVMITVRHATNESGGGGGGGGGRGGRFGSRKGPSSSSSPSWEQLLLLDEGEEETRAAKLKGKRGGSSEALKPLPGSRETTKADDDEDGEEAGDGEGEEGDGCAAEEPVSMPLFPAWYRRSWRRDGGAVGVGVGGEAAVGALSNLSSFSSRLLPRDHWYNGITGERLTLLPAVDTLDSDEVAAANSADEERSTAPHASVSASQKKEAKLTAIAARVLRGDAAANAERPCPAHSLSTVKGTRGEGDDANKETDAAVISPASSLSSSASASSSLPSTIEVRRYGCWVPRTFVAVGSSASRSTTSSPHQKTHDDRHQCFLPMFRLKSAIVSGGADDLPPHRTSPATTHTTTGEEEAQKAAPSSSSPMPAATALPADGVRSPPTTLYRNHTILSVALDGDSEIATIRLQRMVRSVMAASSRKRKHQREEGWDAEEGDDRAAAAADDASSSYCRRAASSVHALLIRSLSQLLAMDAKQWEEEHEACAATGCDDAEHHTSQPPMPSSWVLLPQAAAPVVRDEGDGDQGTTANVSSQWLRVMGAEYAWKRVPNRHILANFGLHQQPNDTPSSSSSSPLSLPSPLLVPHSLVVAAIHFVCDNIDSKNIANSVENDDGHCQGGRVDDCEVSCNGWLSKLVPVPSPLTALPTAAEGDPPGSSSVSEASFSSSPVPQQALAGGSQDARGKKGGHQKGSPSAETSSSPTPLSEAITSASPIAALASRAHVTLSAIRDEKRRIAMARREAMGVFPLIGGGGGGNRGGGDDGVEGNGDVGSSGEGIAICGEEKRVFSEEASSSLLAHEKQLSCAGEEGSQRLRRGGCTDSRHTPPIFKSSVANTRLSDVASKGIAVGQPSNPSSSFSSSSSSAAYAHDPCGLFLVEVSEPIECYNALQLDLL